MVRLERADIIKTARRVVIKIGSNLIASKGCGINKDLLMQLCGSISLIRKRGIEVIIVSSGAVASGCEILKLEKPQKNIPLKQALAAVGQGELIHTYGEIFNEYNIVVAQVLLTHDDIANRKRFLNAKNTISVLLKYGVIPIINENDTVSVEEIKFGDNDNLAGQVVNLTFSNLLILLSDVDGLYNKNPKENPDAEFFTRIEKITKEIEEMAGDNSTKGFGTGGMYTKIRTAKRIASIGVPSIIANGKADKIIDKIFNGDETGTLITPDKGRITSRKHWIGFSMREKGRIVIDNGAMNALLGNGKSLLASGIQQVEGKFDVGDCVTCILINGKTIAKGIVNYSSAEIDIIKGRKTNEIIPLLGYNNSDEVIHRDNMLIFK